MELRTESLSGVPLVAVTGDIDHSTCEEFRVEVDRVLRADDRRICIDLAGCPYIDSGGLAVLLALARWADDGGWIAVVAPNKNVRRLFEIVGLTHDPHFRVFAGREEASRSVAGAS